MDWIDKLNKELEERREHRKTSEAIEEGLKRKRKWIASQHGLSTIEYLHNWQKENNHNIGEIAKNKSDEWIEKIAEAHRGKVRSEEAIQNMSKAQKERADNMTEEERKLKYGGTDESNKQMVETRIKDGSYAVSEETRKKLQQACGAQPVLQFIYNPDSPDGIGEFVKELPSRNAAIREYGTGVANVLGGKQKYCKGFKFIWKKDYKSFG